MHGNQKISVSLLCPVYNEAANVAHIVDFYQQVDYTDKELIFIDGGSSDNTPSVIEQFIARNNGIRLLSNPDKYVSYALNLAIQAARGDILIRIDAHTHYDPYYVQHIISSFEKTSADIVGGPMRIAPGSHIQQAIGYATTTAFGVGNSSFHFETFEGYTETVYLGAWKKEIFYTTGLFDVNLVRNQDDEFHYRARQMGYRIYQDPAISCWYQPRKSYKALFIQYFQYGYYKPQVLRKIPSAFQWRHLIPAIFILYILLIPFLFNWLSGLALIPLAIYLIASFFFSLQSKHALLQNLRIMFVYAILHFAYGSGFIAGLFVFPARKQKVPIALMK